MKLYFYLIAAVLAAFSFGCSEQQESQKETRVKLKVTASTALVADWVKQVGGERVDLKCIAEAGSDPHAYVVSAKKMQTYADSDILVMIGSGFDRYATGGIHEKCSKLALTEELTDLRQGDCSSCTKCASEGTDPHIWYSISLVRNSCQLIVNELIRLDPEGKQYYLSKLKTYQERLDQTYKDLQKQVDRVPKNKRKLVLMHRNLGYFADEFGFTIAGTVLSSFSTETADPSAGEFSDLIKKVKAENIEVVFPEYGINAKLLQILVDECGIRLAKPLLSCNLSNSGDGGENYLQYLQTNIGIICDELSK